MNKVTILNVLDKYPIEIRTEDMAYQPADRHFDRGYFHFLIHKPTDVRRQAQCLEHLFTGLPPLDMAVEFFGGIGLCSALIHGVLKPRKHLIYDIDPFCVRHLQNMTRTWKGTKVIEGDVFDVPLAHYKQAGFYSFDFNTFTIRSLQGRSLENRTLDVAIKTGPRYIQITDSAINKLHMNHKFYSTISGYEINDTEGYYRAFSLTAQKRWGYSVTKVYYHYGAAYMLLESGEQKLNTLEKVS